MKIERSDILSYQPPRLERFGEFRELTLSGALGVGDGATMTVCAAPCECVVAAARS